MTAIGIVLAVFGYAVTYSGVMGLTRGASVGVFESLKPGFTPPTGPTTQHSIPLPKKLQKGPLVPPIERHP